MTPKRKLGNSGKNGGPRTAAGKAIGSRNALRHGLAAITHRQVAPLAEIDRFARTLCGEDDDSELYAAAVTIAESEMTLQAVRAQQVAAVERLRGSYDAPFSKRDNALELTTARFMQAWLASREIDAHLPKVIERYKDQFSAFLRDNASKMPLATIQILAAIGLSPVKEQPSAIEHEPQERDHPQPEGRDEYEALEAAAPDLIRLQRYERRSWLRQKRAICNFANLKLMRAMTTAAKEEKRPARPSRIEAHQATLLLRRNRQR